GFGFDEVHEGIGRTGVVGVLHGASGPAGGAGERGLVCARTDGRADRGGGGAEKRVLFRADMDALPIVEASGVEHASQTKGSMHACGHDGHTTLLLGAAKHLSSAR